MRFLIACCALLAAATAAGQDYAIANIPLALLRNAHAVKRMEEQRFEYSGPREGYLRCRWAVTVLDENGRSAAEFEEYYDRFRKITGIAGTLYDAQGKRLRQLKEKEVEDRSYESDISLVEDNRIKRHHFDYPGYPYTVEYEYTVRQNHSFSFPRWVPQGSAAMSVERSSFTFVAPADSLYRFRALNLAEPAASGTSRDGFWRTWTISNLAVPQYPFASPVWQEMSPMVVTAPNAFAFDKYEGDSKSWENFASFFSMLVQGRDGLPETIRKKVPEVLAGAANDREKVQRLYAFMQHSTRYISIQLGIGGWQPFEAAYVAQKGYGDCKALSNYMYSLLKEAGIRSVYAVIHAGRTESDRFLLEDFPSNQFNHAVLCVPMAQDTMWLECTSQIDPPGYMGSFTGNRKALLILPEGGKLVSTPRYSSGDNLQERHITGIIDAEGNLSVKVRTRYRAEQQDQLFMMQQTLSPADTRKYLQRHIDLPAFDLGEFSYQARPGAMPELEEQLSLQVSSFATVTGKRLFVRPNLLSRDGSRLSDTARSTAIRLGASYTDKDSVWLTVPAGYEVESLPRPVSLQTPYGTYSSSIQFSGDQVVFIRSYQRRPGSFPATDWPAVRRFFNEVYEADRKSIVLVKK